MYEKDIQEILSHQKDNGWKLWATEDHRLLKGSPFSTLECANYLSELGMNPNHEVLQETAALIFQGWKEDGRFRIYPKGSVYPCHTISAVQTLCHLGYAQDARVQKTLQYLLDTQYADGGWRCSKFSFGRGIETASSNPHPTLNALDAFRYTSQVNQEKKLDQAVEFLLQHWTTRKPLGPCHYGIGTLFMQVEYPFRNYNLFCYVYTLSFYDYAKHDPRFLDAFETLRAKLQNGRIVVERVVPKLRNLSICQKGKPSVLATDRYQEIVRNLAKN